MTFWRRHQGNFPRKNHSVPQLERLPHYYPLMSYSSTAKIMTPLTYKSFMRSRSQFEILFHFVKFAASFLLQKGEEREPCLHCDSHESVHEYINAVSVRQDHCRRNSWPDFRQTKVIFALCPKSVSSNRSCPPRVPRLEKQGASIAASSSLELAHSTRDHSRVFTAGTLPGRRNDHLQKTNGFLCRLSPLLA